MAGPSWVFLMILARWRYVPIILKHQFENLSKRKPYKWELESMPNPMIVNYADDILFRGCYRGQKSCHGPLDSLMRVLKKTILKMDARFRYNRGLPRCGFKVKGGWNGLFYFGDENVRSENFRESSSNVFQLYLNLKIFSFLLISLESFNKSGNLMQ